jgi:hypothetical protein
VNLSNRLPQRSCAAAQRRGERGCPDREMLDLPRAMAHNLPAIVRALWENNVTALLKAVPLGLLLTVLVCLFIGSAGSSGGFLNIRSVDIEIDQLGIAFDMYWSWMMFSIGTGLAWVILLMMD